MYHSTDAYSTPTLKGYCSIDSAGKRHEHCRCQDVNEDINDCKAKCDGDSGCIAYSFRDQAKQCYLYTIDSCSSTCEKRMQGQVGNLLERADNGESGCFIKEKGELEKSRKIYLIYVSS